MRISWRESRSPADTVALMLQLARRYRDDMAPWLDCSPLDLYRQLKALPYRPDPVDHESIARPAFVMDPAFVGSRDCDDKSTAWAAWSLLSGVPSVLRVVRADGARSFHHVYPALISGGQAIPLDPTFPDRGRAGWPLYNEAEAIVFPIR